MREWCVRWLAVSICAWCAAPADAQPLGTFSWQLQPYCNVVTVSVTQTGGIYTLDGFDDQCGGAQRAAVTGLASPNPDGTIGFGLTIVAAPSGVPVHVAARITLAALSGTWNDSTGASGAFAFGARTGGGPRPPAALPGAQIAPGSIGVTQVNTSQVQARVTGQCPAGQFATRVNLDGSLDCGVPTTAAADYAGAIRSAPMSGTLIPSTAVSTATAYTMATLGFTAPRTGTAMLRARGNCRLDTLTTGGHTLIVGLYLPGESSALFSDLAAMRVPADSTAGFFTIGFAAERLLPVTGGSTYQVLVRAYHPDGASANALCQGTVSAIPFTSVLP